jgi:hypothetical protein
MMPLSAPGSRLPRSPCFAFPPIRAFQEAHMQGNSSLVKSRIMKTSLLAYVLGKIRKIILADTKKEFLWESAKLRNEIIMNYLLMENSGDFEQEEKKQIIDHLKKHPFAVFPYAFSEKYDARKIIVYKDKKMSFVLHENKRLYFPEKWGIDKIKGYYNGLLIEQDMNSPHCYKAKGFEVRKDEIIADIGAAEGIWALSNADLAGKIYLFECEEKWKAPLEMTFAPYQDKTLLVNKYVRNATNNEGIALDDFFKDKEINFIKADIEGAEVELLDGAKEILRKQRNLRLQLCVYHNQNDAEILKNLLHESGFDTAFSKGYMVFVYDENLHAPYLRRGLIRALRISENSLGAL